MAPDVSEDPVPHDSGPSPSCQFDANPSGGSGDHSSRQDYGSERRYQMHPSDPDALERRDFQNEREPRGSVNMTRMDAEGEGPYGPYRGFYGSTRYDSIEKPFGHGSMGRYHNGSHGRSGYWGDFDRYDNRRGFGGRYGRGGACETRDYGRPRYGYSRAGCGDVYRTYSRDGSYGKGYGSSRGYGYGGEHGTCSTSRMHGYSKYNNRYGSGGNYSGWHGFNSESSGRYGQASYGSSYGGRRPFNSSRFPYDGRDRFTAYGRQYPYGRQPYHKDQYGYGSQRYGYDGNRRENYYDGSRPHFKSGQYGSYNADTCGVPPSFPSFSQSRSPHPTTFKFHDEEQLGKERQNRAKEMAVRANFDLQRRKVYETGTDSAQNPHYARRRPPYFPMDTLRVDFVDFVPKENSKDHRTFPYELMQSGKPSSIFRRGQSFFMELIFQNRDFNPNRDCLFLNFYIGPNPSVPKKTRIVLPVVMQKEFQRAPQQWDVRVHNQEPGKMTLQVHIPSTTAVGCWHCVVETGFRNFTRTRLQYRSPMNMYIIFNPFSPDDSTFMENEDFRTEYVMNDNGKIFMGGFKSAKGRPWVYGQFDDCVLPAACVLLEMSKLAHTEWGNPAKVVRAISAMIKAARSGTIDPPHFGKSNGVIVPHYEEDFRGGSNPHLWTGSVQIIEEFLKGGASPVKYGHCWIMAALMTTFCRALGLACRPVTAFVAAFNTQDSMTIDKYINNYGDPLECGPGRDQPDSLWTFHTWCDVWMRRPDLPVGNSGWQACDPSRAGRGTNEIFSTSCGPCSLEAIRKGDIGFQKDTDAFYSMVNAYVRYFYEAEQSEWGFLPFMQFRFPVARYILTKAPNCSDEGGDEDFEDVTALYKDPGIPEEERFFIYNACRGRSRDAVEFDLKATSSTYGPMPMLSAGEEPDVKFDFQEPVRTPLGEPLTITFIIHNSSESLRTIRANISCRSVFYTGVMGPRMKRVTGRFTFEAGEGETLSLRLDPVEYQDKLIDMSFIKITVTGFVRETTQSFVNEFDFRFDKPILAIEMPDECGEGKECPFELTFMNPLGMTLTECFVTFEINGAVRPQTVPIDREVGLREAFCFRHSFVPRRQGLRHLVACFSSKQLSDVNGMRKILITE